MTSFELFRLFKFNKSLYFIYIFIHFLLKYILCEKLLHFRKVFKYFASNYGITTGITVKLCKKSCRKEKVGRV